MNPLLNRMPETLTVSGKRYPIRWDFRSGLRVILAFEDTRLTGQEQAEIMLRVLYKEPPEDIPAALKQAVWFLNGGEAQSGGGSLPDSGSGRLYSFQTDAACIDSAFRRSYGIDLQTASLHWWQFCRYFMDLSADCLFCRLVSLRERKKRGKLSAEEKKVLARLDGTAQQEYSEQEQAQIADFLRKVR